MSSSEPWRRLVKLIARAFYTEEIPPKVPNKSKAERADNKGIAIVVLDALSRRQWMKEEELAKQIHLHPKQLRRTLKALEEDLLIIREHRKENVKTLKRYNQAISVLKDGEEKEEAVEEEKLKIHTHSYCALNYAQIYDVIRYRIHRAKKKIKDELEDRNTVQEYICPNPTCNKRFSAFDAMALLNPVSQNFHCENCRTELVIESEQMGAKEGGEGGEGGGGGGGAGEENVRRKRREALRALYAKLDSQLKPLQDQIHKLKELTPPNYGSLAEWEMRASNVQRAMAMGEEAAGMNANKRSFDSSLLHPMPSVGETKFLVNIGGEGEENKGEESAAGKKMTMAHKVIPAWARREGMNLNAAQRGEGGGGGGDENAEMKDMKVNVKEEQELASTSLSEDKEEEARLQAYYAAYFAALQQAQVQPQAQMTIEENVQKVKKEVKEEMDMEEEEENVEWEEEEKEQMKATSTMASAMVNEFEEDNFEWEEGDEQEAMDKDDAIANKNIIENENVIKNEDEFDDEFDWEDG